MRLTPVPADSPTLADANGSDHKHGERLNITVRVRHEVALIAVTQEESRCNLVFCHQYPTPSASLATVRCEAGGQCILVLQETVMKA